MNSERLMLLVFAAIATFLICFAIYGIVYEYKKKKEAEKTKNSSNNNKEKDQGKINANTTNNFKFINNLGEKLRNEKLEKIFNDAKNPWGISMSLFQIIRFGGFLLSISIGLIVLMFSMEIAIFIFGIGALFMWYPMYYYKAIGKERAQEWNKMYEFIWVIKHNCMLYDAAKAFLNTKNYIQEHAPHDKEIIQGFQDFYDYYNDDEIPEYIDKYYSFSIPREIYQIVFNMHKSGEFPEDQLNSLRQFIINSQNLIVEKTLSGVSSKATIFSLPFLMVSVIASLLVPLIFQLVGFL